MNSILALKLFLVPSLICAVTLAGQRWGPAVAGWLSAFPIVAGPILLAISLEQGAGFAVTTAEGTLMAVLATVAFTLAYAWSSGRLGVSGAMPLALGAWALAVAGLQSVRLPLPCAALAVIAALLVMSVSTAVAALGPRLSGFFAMSPVMGTVLVGFTHVQAGRHSAVQLLRGMILGYFAFAAFCVAIALLLRAQPVAASFFCAFVFALTIQLLVKAASSRRRAT